MKNLLVCGDSWTFGSEIRNPTQSILRIGIVLTTHILFQEYGPH